ncbi:FAD/NAD(P)-binding protein [Sphingomonas edaphi]|uniref:FAD-binding protein n=1 Tax=Sphingomonas edaphi TaxID=2315689 RepID=A0A418Q232_9SPHN|nr:FAD/NAD(P)-binding protein [Sphingomonas edaphi]RIX31894.1 FAD-binding protein [Sphingomonas edaphi]
MKSDFARADVLIVGGGFSGTMLAAQLARRSLSSIIIEGADRAGRGTAFSTPEEAHLLNVPAARMSAWPDLPDDFAQHVQRHGFTPADFVPRQEFGDYLRTILDEAIAGGCVQLIAEEASDASPVCGGWTVEAGGKAYEGRALALAQGNLAPQVPGVARDLPRSMFVNDPWSEEGQAAIACAAEDGADVLCIGTGLTMVDVVLSLTEAGHAGRILAVSRRGLVPRSHAPNETAPVERDDVPQGSLLSLWRWLRKRTAIVGWRAAVDSLRPHSQALWHSLDTREQKRFLRHARPWWDIHRHRIAPQIADRLEGMVKDRRLEVMAGRVASLVSDGAAVDAAITPRGASQDLRRRFGLAINCTGPLGAIRFTRDPMLHNLLSAGRVEPDGLGMGLQVDGRGRAEGSERLWAVGPLTKGVWWEIVAVPDIRQQVAVVADDIAEELEQ